MLQFKDTLTNVVAFEGIDGCGKTSILKALVQDQVINAQDYHKKIIPTKEPYDETGIEPIIRKYLRGDYNDCSRYKDVLLHLFVADRFVHEGEFTRNLFKTDNIYISDRHLFSTLAYQQLHFDFDYIYQILKKCAVPKYIVYFKVDPIIAVKRVTARSHIDSQEIFENITMQQQLEKNYNDIFHSKRVIMSEKEEESTIFTINANKEFAEVVEDTKKIIQKIIN